MDSDKQRLEKKGLTWEEFNKRLDGIFYSIQKLIEDTNDTKTD